MSSFSRRTARALYRLEGGRGRQGTLFLRQLRRMGRALRGSTRRLRVLCVGGAVGTVLLVLSLLFFSSLFSITSMRVSRQDARVDIEELQQLLRPFFGRHLLFLPSQLIERRLLEAYPEVAAVQVRKELPHTLHVILAMDPLSARVRVGSPEDTEQTLHTATGAELRGYLTSQGVYLEYPASLAIPGRAEALPLLELVDWAVRPAHRQRLLEETALQSIMQATDVLQQSFGHAVRTVTFYLRAREFHVQTERPILWLDLASPLVQQLERYRSFLRALPRESAEGYVDLRLHDRVVYR